MNRLVLRDRMATSYSMWNLFRNCRKAAEWKYVHGLVPLERDRNLALGSLVHECLEIWHRTRDLAGVEDHIDRATPKRAFDSEQKRTWHLLVAMMRGYAARFPSEEFEVVALEQGFEAEIRNPKSSAPSRSFTLAGRIDGIVKIEGEHWILEHKSAAGIDAAYLERLWTDFQTSLYARYAETALGYRIAGVVYNVLVKARLQQSAGETEEEFEARRAELIAKSKTGKSSAQRRTPETDEEFQARLAEKYAEPGMFHRERLVLAREQTALIESELWELTQQFLDARRRQTFYQNTSHCFAYGRPCAYFQLCRSGGNPVLIENLYERRSCGSDESLAADVPGADLPGLA